MPDFPSLPGLTNVVYRDPSTGRLRQGVAGDDFYLSFPSTGGATQALAVGIDDDTPGAIYLYGGSATESSGEARFYLPSDQDGTYEYWRAYVSGTEFAIEVGGGSPAILINPSDNGVSIRGAGGLYVGVNDTQAGFIHVMGHGASNNYGGSFRLYMAADYDTTDDYWNYWVYQDDLYISLATTGDIVKVDPAGQFSLLVQGASAGLVIGSDVHLYRGASNTLYLGTGDSLNVVSGSVNVASGQSFTSGGTQIIAESSNTVYVGYTSTWTGGIAFQPGNSTAMTLAQNGVLSLTGAAGNATVLQLTSQSSSLDATIEFFESGDALVRYVMGHYGSGNRFYLWSTDINGGGGLDGFIFEVLDGTDDISFYGNVSATGGLLTVGSGDATRGLLSLYGPATGSSDGGAIELYMGADHDTTYEKWLIGVSQDNLTFTRNASTLVGQFDINGQFQLPIQGVNGGILIGGDVQLYRSAADVLTIADSVYVSGSLLNTGGYLAIGTTGNNGIVEILGDGTGSSSGGVLRLYMADDHDTTYEYHKIVIVEDDLTFGVGESFTSLRLTAEGQIQAPVTGSSAGILIGGDVQLYRSGANALTIPDTVYVTQGTLSLGVDDTTSGVLNLYGGATDASYIYLYTSADADSSFNYWQIKSGATGDSSFYISTDQNVVFRMQGTTLGVNFWEMLGSVTTGALTLRGLGSDTDISLSIYGKGAGAVYLGANFTDYLSLYGGTGTATISATGASTNVVLSLVGKGTGGVKADFIGVGNYATPSSTTGLNIVHQGNATSGTVNPGLNLFASHSPSTSSSASVIGAQLSAVMQGSNNLTGAIYGATTGVTHQGTGTISSSIGLSVGTSFSAAGTITNAYGVAVGTAYLGGVGTVGNQYGVYLYNMNTATNNYGLFIEGASTYSIYVQSGRVFGQTTDTTVGSFTTTYGNFYIMTAAPASSSTNAFISIFGRVISSTGNVDNIAVGVFGDAYAEHTSGTVASLQGVRGQVVANGTGGTTTQAAAMFAAAAAASAGTLTNAYGLYVESQTVGATGNYGVYIAGSSTYALWVDSGVSRFDGDGTHVFELPADATDPTGGGGAAAGRIPITVGGVTKYIPYY